MQQKTRVLHIDDNLHDRQLVKDTLLNEHDEFEVVEADTREKFEYHIAHGCFDLVLSDFNILGFDGLQVLQIVKEKDPDLPVIIVTGTGSEEIAIQAMKMGAADYVIKSVKHIKGLVPTIKSVLRNKQINEERKDALSALRESEELYRSIYDNSSVAILLTSPEGNIFAANNFACRLFGMTEEEICKAGRNGLVDPLSPNLSTLLEERSKTGRAKGELTFVKKDGTQFQAEVSSAIFMDKDQKEKTSMVIRDLTEQRQAEKQLQTLGKAIEQSPASIIITNDHGNIEFTNTKFTSYMQYTHEEVKGQKPGIFKPECCSSEIFKNMWKTIKSGNVWQGEFENRRKDGTMFWENVIISPLVDDAGQMVNYILISEDISEKKKILDDLVIAKEKAEESDQLKTAFLQNISHEIRTPMNAIIGFSGFLSDPAISPEKRTYYTEIIIQSTNQLLAIINDIVTIATIQTGQEKVQEKEFNLNSTFKILHKQFMELAQKQEVVMNYQTALPDAEATILTDPTKLTQILFNLVGNAVKFTKKGFVNFGYNLKGAYLEFYVEDTGIGISADMHDEIFERFRQVETMATRQFGGSGLGLSISKAYVELLGGKIWLKSELQRGSTFYFTILYKKPEPVYMKESIEPGGTGIDTGKPGTILVAEDEDSNFILIRELLSDLKVQLMRAVNGLEAVEACKTNAEIALVLMDIKMPKMDGFEATKQIKKLRPDLPVIAQTAYTSEADKNKAFASGCDDFISKPIRRDLLISKINEQFTNPKS
ncbi:MAG TPA: response regulator [Bacteroidales bacterium]